MAGWIKLCDTLPDCQALLIMKRHLGGSRNDTLALAIRWLFFLDKNTQDGKTRLFPDEVDAHFHTPNFTQALVDATWAKIEKDGTVSARDFEIHNGDTTKKRLMQSIYDSRRGQTKSRTKSGKSQKTISNPPESNLEISRTKSGQDKIREEKNNIVPNSSLNPPLNTARTRQLPPRQNDCNANRRYDW